MRILVTAFAPFGGESENPTARIIAELQGVDTLLLPVSFAVAPKMVLEKIAETAPDAVILLGQAGGRAAISLERVAINLADAKNPDNDGYAPSEKKICENAPSAYICPLPLGAMRDSVRDAGVPCHISNTAGAYVCNAVYYSVMHGCPGLPAVFIHVPYSPRQAVSKSVATPSMNITDMTAAVNAVIDCIKATAHGITGRG